MDDFKWDDFPEVKTEVDAQASKLESAARGAVQGLTLGGADEITGAIEAGVEKLKGSEDPIYDLYRKYQKQSEAEYKKAKEANPLTYGASELGAGIASSFALPVGAGIRVAKNAPLLVKMGAGALTGAGLGAVTGGLGSESTLDQPEELAKGVAGGAAIGGILGGAVPLVAEGASRAAERLVPEDSRLYKILKKSYEKGQAGEDLASEASKIKAAAEARSGIESIAKGVVSEDYKLGQAVGSAFSKAEAQGARVVTESSPAIETLRQYDLQGPAKKELNSILDKLSGSRTTLTNEPSTISPSKAKELVDEIKEFSSKTDDRFLKDSLSQIRDSLESQIPGLAEAKAGLSAFRKSVIEPFQTGTQSPYLQSLNRDFYSNAVNKEVGLLSDIASTVKQAASGAKGSAESLRKLNQLKENFKQATGKEIPLDDILTSQGLISELGTDATAKIPIAHTALGWAKKAIPTTPEGAATAGRLSVSAPVNIAKSIYNLPASGMTKLSEHLRDAGQKEWADSIQKSLDSKNTFMLNATLFSMMQRPDLRQTIGSFLGSQIPQDQNQSEK